MTTQVPLDVLYYLPGLVINRSEGRFLTKQEPIDPNGNDMESVFQEIY